MLNREQIRHSSTFALHRDLHRFARFFPSPITRLRKILELRRKEARAAPCTASESKTLCPGNRRQIRRSGNTRESAAGTTVTKSVPRPKSTEACEDVEHLEAVGQRPLHRAGNLPRIHRLIDLHHRTRHRMRGKVSVTLQHHRREAAPPAAKSSDLLHSPPPAGDPKDQPLRIGEARAHRSSTRIHPG